MVCAFRPKYGSYTNRYSSTSATTPFKSTMPPYRSSLPNNENQPSAANVSATPTLSGNLKDTGRSAFAPASCGTQRSHQSSSFAAANASAPPYSAFLKKSGDGSKPRKLSEGLDLNAMSSGTWREICFSLY